MHAKNQISLTRKTLYGIMLIAVFVTAFGARSLSSVLAQEMRTNATINKEIPPGWNIYTDIDYGFQIAYAAKWKTELVYRDLENTGNVNKKRIAIHTEDKGLFYISIWEAPTNESLFAWINGYKVGYLSNQADIPTESNSVVSGRNSYFIVSPPEQFTPGILSTIFINDNLIYTIEYIGFDGGNYQEEYVNMLETFEIDINVPTDDRLPVSPFYEAQEVGILGTQDCCGYHDGQPNRYDCDGGNCTWWAAYKRNDISDQWMGNAYNWKNSAPSYGLVVGQTPQVGAIAVFQPSVQGADPTYGHVAYVEQVYSSTSFRMTSMWWQGNCTIHDETKSTGTGVDFIYQGGGGSLNPPTLLSPSAGQTLTSRSVHFTWQNPNSTNQSGYTFRLSTSSNPDTQPWLKDTGLGNEYTSYDFTFSSDGTYYWHMRTWNTSNQASSWVTRSFIVNTSGGGGNNPPSGFAWCADEDGRCNFSGTADVVYGAVNSFTSPRSFTNGVDCNNSVFGDPISGTRKACYYKITSPPPSGNWHVEYFNSKDLNNRCYDSYENSTYIFKNWGTGSPANGCNSDNFSTRFTSMFNFPGGSYSFHCQHDDGCRIFIDGQEKLNAWWDSSFTGHDWGGSLSGNHEVKIEFYDSGGDARLEAFWSGSGFLPAGPGCVSGEWCGQYFGNRDLAGTPAVQRNEGNTNIDYTWNDGSIGFGFPTDNFSARWQRNVYFAAGRYRFHIRTDDGGRLWVNNNLVIDQWKDQGATEYTVDLNLSVGTIPLKFEYYENGGGASAQMWWDALEIYQPPSANFDAWPLSGMAPFTSTMHIVDTSNITACSWSYGDGQTGTSCTSTHDHVYNSAGAYTVSLTVSGPGGSGSMSRTDYITVSATPPTPGNFHVSATSTDSITLAWDDVSGETGYKIYKWGHDGTQWMFIYLDTVGANATTYTDANLPCGNDFNYYEVSAYNSYGESEHHSWIQGITDACPPAELTIVEQSYYPDVVHANDSISIYNKIQNSSMKGTQGFWIDLYVDRQPTGCGEWGEYAVWIDELPANAIQTWRIKIPAGDLSIGSHTIYAYIDSGCGISEANENNNLAGPIAIEVLAPPPAPDHDDFDSARPVSPLPYTDIVDVSGAWRESDDPSVSACDLAPGLASVWYQYTPSRNTKLSLDTFGSDYDTYIAVWTGSRGNLAPVGCNDDSSSTYQSSLQINVTAGTTYYIQIAEYDGRINTSALEIPPGMRPRPGEEIPTEPGPRIITSSTTPKPTSDVGALAGGSLTLHVTDLTQTKTFYSVGSADGYILESTETSNRGGSLNATLTTFSLGDYAGDKQFRSILHFNTSGLPDNAVITKVTLKIKKQGLVGTNPFTTHGGLKVDIRKPFFGTSVGLLISDFQAAASKSAVGTFGTTPVSGWYSTILGNTAFPYINLTGTTQFRLRFAKDDNDDMGADYMKFFSGNYATASYRPTLIIEYYVP